MADTLLISGLQLADASFVVDAEIDIAGLVNLHGSEPRSTIWIEEICDEISRISEAAGPQAIESLAALLVESLMAAFPELLRVMITVWEESPVVEEVAVDAIGVRITRERDSTTALQGQLIRGPRPR